MKNTQPGLFDDEIIADALKILESRINYNTDAPCLTSPEAAKQYVKLQLAENESEVFSCLFLDNCHRVISFDKLFYGTIDACSVYPRSVLRAALCHNAAAVIFAHNHPSGVAEPSSADRQITERLKSALELIDVRVLDHLVVGEEVISFSERRLI